MGVDGRVAVAGEVLGAGGDPGGLEPLDIGGGVPGDEAGFRAEGADADDRVAGVGVDVGGRGPVEVDPARGQGAAQLPGDLAGERGVLYGDRKSVV